MLSYEIRSTKQNCHYKILCNSKIVSKYAIIAFPNIKIEIVNLIEIKLL